MEIAWDEAKNDKLKAERGISFEEVASELIAGRVLDVVQHPSRPGQRVFIVKIREHFVMAPFVFDDQGVFLKTAYISRKARKKFGDKK